MNRDEWFQCEKVSLMLNYLWSKHNEDSLIPVLHQYYLRCARNIEILLPQRESIRGIEIGEDFLEGKIDEEKLSSENWAVEGAAFRIEYDTEPKKIRGWVKGLDSLEKSKLEKVLFGVDVSELDMRELLIDAAYFVDHAMIFPNCSPKNTVSDSYVKFLSTDILRDILNDPEKTPNK